MSRSVQAVTLLTALLAFAPARADLTSYPISGRWGVVHGTAHPDCRKPPFMEFAGNRRFDFGGSSVPEYRAISIVPTDGAAFRVEEIFFNGLIEGKMSYTLRIGGNGRASMQLHVGGRRIDLEHCG